MNKFNLSLSLTAATMLLTLTHVVAGDITCDPSKNACIYAQINSDTTPGADVNTLYDVGYKWTYIENNRITHGDWSTPLTARHPQPGTVPKPYRFLLSQLLLTPGSTSKDLIINKNGMYWGVIKNGNYNIKLINCQGDKKMEFNNPGTYTIFISGSMNKDSNTCTYYQES